MKQSVEIVRGTTNTFGIAVTDADGEAYTLTGQEFLVFGLKRNRLNNDRVLTKKITNLADGVYYLELTPEDTAGLEPGKYFYDVGLQSGSLFYPVIELSEFLIKPNAAKSGDF